MVYYFNKFTIVCKYMIFQQHCNNLNIKYYEELIEINIENIRNNIEKFKIYNLVLEYLVYNENDLKRIFKSL